MLKLLLLALSSFSLAQDVILPKDPQGNRDQLHQRVRLKERQQAFFNESAGILLIPKALVFSMDEADSICDMILKRDEWIKSELRLIRQNENERYGIQFADGFLTYDFATRPDMFSYERVLGSFADSYCDSEDQAKEIEIALLERGFSLDDLAHLRFFRSPGNAPIDTMNRLALKEVWKYSEDNVLFKFSKKMIVGDDDLEAHVQMELAAHRKAKTDWTTDFLVKLSKQSRRVILSYVFSDFTRSLTQYRLIEPSIYFRKEIEMLRMIQAEVNNDPAMLMELRRTIRHEIDQKDK